MIEDYNAIKQPQELSYYTIKQPKKQSQVNILLQFITSLLLIQLVLLIIQGILTQQYSTELEQPRFRIIANSNSAADQQYKHQLVEKIKPILENAIQNSSTELNLSTIENQIKSKLSTEMEKEKINITTTKALFPPKRNDYKMYAQDKYQAIVVTIGTGKGDNWWCGLFPKVCYREEDSKKENEEEEEKPKFFIVEWFKSLFKD
ncbi:stage II sporulation protein R [Rummeliibacillus pycnus]|uniref:stage II sporulation protein R n=1 Tax=Rummeliibacillus pycnus TaxID=101070 RepID=UPI0014760E69|nr:stage II sporulation protein R [Rummeliibacillus pycnus]